MKYGIDPSAITTKHITVTFFEMHERPVSFRENNDVEFRLQQKPIDIDRYLTLYAEVGRKHFWVDRIVMDENDLSALINDPGTEIFTIYMYGQTAGFAEFIIREKCTEILYFGLLPAFIGKGLGKYALDWAIHQAWSYDPQWVQLNTCELDKPHAIANYRARGFKEVRKEVHQRRMMIK